MPQVTNPEVAKVFLMADRGMELWKAFDKVKPGVSWPNVRRWGGTGGASKFQGRHFNDR